MIHFHGSECININQSKSALGQVRAASLTLWPQVLPTNNSACYSFSDLHMHKHLKKIISWIFQPEECDTGQNLVILIPSTANLIFSQKIYLTDLLSRSAETSVLIAETEISREEQKLARNSQGLPGTEEKKKKSQLLLKLKNLLILNTVKREPEILINCCISLYSIGLAFYNKHTEIT